MKLKDLDFRFENTLIKIIANRNHPEIKLAGITIPPLQEGNEYELHYWIAQELTNQGITHFREEDTLDATKLYKIQWKERVQAPGQISELPDDFYPKLRRYLQNMKQQIAQQPTPQKVQEYERTQHLANDIINSRLKKIVTLSSGPTQTDQITKKLTTEEKQIYLTLSKTVTQYRTNINQTREGTQP
jgi:hypothetical protein